MFTALIQFFLRRRRYWLGKLINAVWKKLTVEGSADDFIYIRSLPLGIVKPLTFEIQIVMWCLRCCPCWKGSANSELEQSGLLGSPHWQTKDGEPKTQYYTVRRISSFGRTGSGDDISDTAREQEEKDVRSPAEFWTAKIHRVQPDSIDGDYNTDVSDSRSSPKASCKPVPHGRWRRAFYPFRPRRERSKSREQKEAGDLSPPAITVSSPDLNINDVIQTSGKGEGNGHVSTLSNELEKRENEAAQIARSYGLDTSLYTPDQLEGSAPMSRSTEALSVWQSPGKAGKSDWLQEPASGIIHFTAAYFQKNKKLFVHVNKLERVPVKGEHYTYSVVVKLTILPYDKPVRVSKVFKNELNPEIEEDFEFIIKDPLGKVLRLSVFDADHQGKYDAIGHALFYLEDVIAGRPRRYTMKLYKQSQPDVAPGNIQVSLSYKQETMTLSVLVVEACNLLLSTGSTKSTKLTDKYNTYIKVAYFSGGQKMKSKKGTTVSNSRNPTYNQTFNFKLSSNFLHDSYIVITVMMKGLLKKDVPIGRLVLGPFHYAEGREKTPWGRALLDQEVVTHFFRMYL